MSADRLARMCGMSRAAISQLVNGHRSIPSTQHGALWAVVAWIGDTGDPDYIDLPPGVGLARLGDERTRAAKLLLRAAQAAFNDFPDDTTLQEVGELARKYRRQLADQARRERREQAERVGRKLREGLTVKQEAAPGDLGEIRAILRDIDTKARK
jgi:hypothetical protein